MSWRFLTDPDRRDLVAALADLDLVLQGQIGRRVLLNQAGLGHLLPSLQSLADNAALTFAGELVAALEDSESLPGPPPAQALGALLAHVLSLGDTPGSTHDLCAALIVAYALIDDSTLTDRLRADYALPAGTTPWRVVRRDITPALPPDARAESLQALRALEALLVESKSALNEQVRLRSRLIALIRTNRPGQELDFEGQDDLFYQLSAAGALNAAEKDRFGDVRLSTMVIRDVDVQLLDWVRAHPIAGLYPVMTPAGERLGKQLDALKNHLNYWLKRYDNAFAHDEHRALVFMADEKHRGPGWPHGLTPAVKAAIRELEQ
jgi:hypothetical protein